MQSCIKRIFDIIVSATVLLLCLPLLGLLWIWVRLVLGSPAIFTQERLGKGHRPFKLYKFRSMRVAADSEGHSLSDGERLTHFGEMLRATSLDELPELWNILKGEMSLVGPRPLLPEYLPYYTQEQLQRHRIRPGLTGLAQVRGRNVLSWEERLALDIQYVNSWSLWLDFTIILNTVRVVLSRQGVHAEGQPTMMRFDDHIRALRQANALPSTKP